MLTFSHILSTSKQNPKLKKELLFQFQCLFQLKIFSRKENIFKCLVAFQQMLWKIFSSVWLCSENAIFYQFLTFSQPFSQLPNKFHNRKFQYINLKQTKIKTKPIKNQNKTYVNTKNSVKRREGGRESDRQVRERERQIKKERDRAWVGHVDRSSWRRDRSTWMWIDLVGAGVLVCYLGGAWMNKHSPSRGGDEDGDLIGPIVGSTARSLSLSLSLCVFALL